MCGGAAAAAATLAQPDGQCAAHSSPQTLTELASSCLQSPHIMARVSNVGRRRRCGMGASACTSAAALTERATSAMADTCALGGEGLLTPMDFGGALQNNSHKRR